MSREAWAEIIEQIKAAHNILVLSHHSPDPDAFGSSCGLTLALQHLGKKAVCVNEDGAVPNLSFIPNADKVLDHIPNEKFDIAIVCDCGDRKRIGENILSELPNDLPLINIDHHYSNTNFGNFNLVEGNASSASEVVYSVASDLLGTLLPDVAECLLTGIIADTGGFRYSSTSAFTFLVAEKLVKAGADVAKINVNLFSNKPISAVRLAASAINNMKTYADGKVVELLVTPEMMTDCSAVPTDCDGLVEIGRDIKGVLVSALIRKVDDIWKVSLRSKFPQHDISKVAAYFHGGGHVQASAFRWSGELSEFREDLINRLIQVVEDN